MEHRFRPIHPAELAKDWDFLSPEGLATLQQHNLDVIARKLALSTRGKFCLVMLFTGAQVTGTDGGPAVIRGENGFPHLIPPRDWDRIKLLFRKTDIENL